MMKFRTCLFCGENDQSEIVFKIEDAFKDVNRIFYCKSCENKHELKDEEEI